MKQEKFIKILTCDYNIQQAKKNGLQVGVCFFSQAATVEAREEAEFTLHVKSKTSTIDLQYV